MKKSIIKTMFTILLLCGITHATSFEVTQVIEVGSASEYPILGPIKWSPDGTKLSYFDGNKLMMSDTLGNSVMVKELDMIPHRYEWVSNQTIAFDFKKYDKPGESYNRLVVLDITDTTEELISAYRYDKNFKTSGQSSYGGPRLTQEGKAFYEISTASNGQSSSTSSNRIMFAQNKNGTIDSSLTNNHILQWRGDAIYKIEVDNNDSIVIKNGFGTQDRFVKLSKDDKYLSFSYNLINLENSESILLLDYIGEIPENTYFCDIFNRSFNPQYSELLFQIGCEGEEPFVVEKIGTYNYEINQFIVLSDQLLKEKCSNPIYHPDGKKIAFLSDGTLLIVLREEL